MNPRRALWITLAIPGTDIEIKLRIVRNDMSLIKPQIHCMIQETPAFKKTPYSFLSLKKVIPPLKLSAIKAWDSVIYGSTVDLSNVV
jgi:hypothetical protein